MGANPNQAYALILFFGAFVLICAGSAMETPWIALTGILPFAGSIAMFFKIRPWEQ